MINCLILEDEQDAQEILETYVSKLNYLNLIGKFESGIDVPPSLLKKADLLFLDIQLPELNGIQYLRSLGNPPKVIVTTAYDQFAIEAFEVEVIDYLLKPFSFERFLKATTRLRRIVTTIQNTATYFVYADKTTYKIKASDILYLKAEVDYVKVKTIKQEILILDSLKNWNEKLEEHTFLRVHRSYIVNMEKVDKISKNRLFLQNTECLPIGAKYKEAAIARFFE
ncbi:MAG: LytTR family DNA-binding domain-containing protein [Bacteroidota bacterium]